MDPSHRFAAGRAAVGTIRLPLWPLFLCGIGLPTHTFASEPIPASGSMVLPATVVERDLYESFIGSPALSIDTLGIYHFGRDTAGLRSMVNLGLGPISLALGVMVADGTDFNVSIDAFSYQSNGWECALGYGLEDGPYLHVGAPLIEGLRARVFTSMNLGGNPIIGLGLEAAPW